MNTDTLHMLAATFLFGLSGSFHCTLMCGSLAGLACGQMPGSLKSRSRWNTWIYQGTRLVSYMLLGCLAGLVSALTIKLPASGHWFGLVSGLLFGLMIITYALLQLVNVLVKEHQPRWLHRLTRLTQPVAFGSGRKLQPLQTWLTALPFPRPVSFGILTALLPCGFLYAGLAQSALHAHPVFSALSMGLFAIASSPALALGGGIIAWLYRKAPRFSPILLPLLIAASGAFILWRALSPPHHHPHDPPPHGHSGHEQHHEHHD